MADPKPVEAPEGTEFEDLRQNEPDGGLSAYKAVTDKKLADIEQLTKAILLVAVISLVGVVVACAGLILDQMHFNNQTYTQQRLNK